MNDSSPLPWEDLSPSARGAVADLIYLLTQKFSGKIEIECACGGVRNFRDTRDRKGPEIGTLSDRSR